MMDNIRKNARRLDVFFNIMQICCIVAAVAAAVALLLTGICFLFKLDPEMIGTGYNILDFNGMELEIHPEFAPDKHTVLLVAVAELVGGVITAILGWKALAQVRGILAPMKQGLPFHEDACFRFKRLALLCLIIGIVLNVSEFVSFLLTKHYYHLPELLKGEGLLRVNMQFDFDFTCLLVSGILLLLSYIFRYGQSLQQLSDETL